MPTAAEQVYNDTINRLSQQAGMLDPNAVQAVLADGGSLSGGFGFNTGNDLLGMSPEQVQQLINNRGLIQQQNSSLIENAGKLNDMITGGAAKRQMQFAAAGQQFQAASEDARQQSRLDAEKVAQKERMQFEDKWKTNEYNLSKWAKEQEIKYQNASLGLTASYHKAMLKLENKKLDLESRRQLGMHYAQWYNSANNAVTKQLDDTQKAIETNPKVKGSQRDSALWTVNLKRKMVDPVPGTVVNVPTDFFGSSLQQKSFNIPKETKYLYMKDDGNFYAAELVGKDANGRPQFKIPKTPTIVNPYKQLHQLRKTAEPYMGAAYRPPTGD